jgi:hypothetical protein
MAASCLNKADPDYTRSAPANPIPLESTIDRIAQANIDRFIRRLETCPGDAKADDPPSRLISTALGMTSAIGHT